MDNLNTNNVNSTLVPLVSLITDCDTDCSAHYKTGVNFIILAP
jgi:hypothetical protein